MMTHADELKLLDEELILLSESVELSFDTFVELSGLTPAELQLLIDCGAIIPCQMSEIPSLETIKFNSHYLISIRKLVRLKQDFELETNSLGLMLVFLERVRTLELQLHQLTNQSDVNY